MDPENQPLRKLYWERRMSIRQIASTIGMSYQGTRKRLQKLGPLRSKSEGRIRHQRRPFSEKRSERAYLLGLRAGDVNAWRKSPNTIEARVSTTHPSMTNLFSNVFGRYGHLMLFAERAYLPGHFRWQSKVHLDSTFGFLVPKPRTVPRESNEFYRFLGGYSDAECNWSIYPQRSRIRVSWTIESFDGRLISQVGARLLSLGFHPLLYQKKERHDSGTKTQKAARGERIRFRMSLCRTDEVISLALKLIPCSMHSEKLARMRLILAHPRGAWPEVAAEIQRLRRLVEIQVSTHERNAQRAYNNRRKHRLRVGSSASLV